MNRHITLKKKLQKLYKCQHFLGLQLAGAAPVLEAGGKPSTWFPPEGLVELPSHVKKVQMSPDDFLFQECHISQI